MKFANPLSLLFGLGLLLTGTQALALPTDREQPIRVQANSAELDDKRGVAVYRGNVVITQGSIRVTGDTVTIARNPQGDIDVFTAVGKPASYEQKPAEDKPVLKATGMTIQYFTSQDRVVLIDQASIVQGGNTFQGEKIVYDTRRQIVNAGRASTGQVSAPQPRIDMVIQPNKNSPQEAQ